VAVALLAVAGFSSGARAKGAETFPPVIDLPNGWQPEGVVTGRGPIIYSGSLATGAIYAADLRTGEGSILVQGQPGRVAVGLSFDQRTNYIFAAGGRTGQAYVYDAATGEEVAAFTFTSAEGTFINDVIVTRDAAYFTNSQRSEIYRVALGPGGSVPTDGTFGTITLSGDFAPVIGFNLNGIEATPNGKTLIVVQSATGLLFQVDPVTGVTTTINLGGAKVNNGDGLLLQGSKLYVVQNRLNQIAVINLASDLGSGTIVETITDSDFAVPTTVAAFGNRLYAVNARFGTTPTPDTEYSIVQVTR
jgi:sugar lactone lactonase YvrE